MRSSILAAAAAAAIAVSLAAPSASAQSKDWEVTLTPYIWISWPEGDIEAKSGPISGGGNLPEINASFDDVGLSGAFTGSGDFRYRNFGVFGDLTYYELEAEKDITILGDIFVDGQFEVTGTKGMLAGYWRALDDGRNTIDLLAGIHYLKAEVGVDLTTAARAINASIDEDWVDPLIGIRGTTALSDHFGIEGFATYGGWGVSSEELYDIWVAAYWRFNQTFAASLGYRYFTDKFEGDRLAYEASFSGPLLGLAFHF